VRLIWGIVLIIVSALAWGGQTVSWFEPATAARLGLSERESDVEPQFWADIRGEALWDVFTLWTLGIAGVLLVLDAHSWAYFGLVGGGTYLYFAGRGIAARVAWQRRGFRVGSPDSVKLGLVVLAVWGIVAVVTIIAAVVDLEGA